MPATMTSAATVGRRLEPLGGVAGADDGEGAEEGKPEEQVGLLAQLQEEGVKIAAKPACWKASEAPGAAEAPKGAEKCFARLGKSQIYVLRVGGWRLYIGPHWYCTLIMLAAIVAVGLTYTWQVAVDINKFHVVAGYAVTSWSSYALFRCALSDPGIIPAQPSAPGGAGKTVQALVSSGKRVCGPCGIFQPAGAMHCEYCHTCVSGWDHHCPWMSKCIGDKNLSLFYRFLQVSFGSLGYIVLTTIVGWNP